MSRAAAAPGFRPLGPTLRRPKRDPLVRRDPRRFARGAMRLGELAPPPAANSDWRFFAHSFVATFFFVSLLIA